MLTRVAAELDSIEKAPDTSLIVYNAIGKAVEQFLKTWDRLERFRQHHLRNYLKLTGR
jgi:hypothetical protein